MAGPKSRIINTVNGRRPSGEAPVPDARFELMERIAASPNFQRAPKITELFLHLCRNALAGKEHLLTEQQIGCSVFQRAATYNPGDDSIVRSQVRLLRRKLELWFSEEGREEPVVLSIPRGGYVPLWAPRAESPAEEPPLEIPAAPSSPPTPDEGFRLDRRQWIRAGFAAMGLSGAFALGQLIRTPTAGPSAPLPPHPILAGFFDGTRPVLLVVQDAALTLVNNSLRSTVSLQDFQSGSYKARLAQDSLSDDQRRLLQMIDSRQYTSVGDVAILRSLWQTFPAAVGSLEVILPRHLHLRQLKAANAILVGGRAANPWVDLYEDRLTFRLESGAGSLRVRNRNPARGERDEYLPTEDTAYAVLAMLANGEGPGRVLLMGGTSLEATEGAGQFAIIPRHATELAARLSSAAPTGRFSTFEAIIRTHRLDGTSTRSEIAAVRAY